jgi:hypothetical protein
MALVQSELLGLLLEDRKRLARVEDVHTIRPNFSSPGSSRVRGHDPFHRDEALDLNVLHAVERLGSENVLSSGDLDDPGPVPHQDEDNASGGARAQHPTADTDSFTEGILGEGLPDRS